MEFLGRLKFLRGASGWRMLRVFRKSKDSCRCPSPRRGFSNPSDPEAGEERSSLTDRRFSDRTHKGSSTWRVLPPGRAGSEKISVKISSTQITVPLKERYGRGKNASGS
jgi:hypothetical protein